ncbi:MAG: hypothetical protein LBD11_08475 [Candidatus Peribacteria bacterium]|nr:hypothetical protein [Candidatus Peribacteria bacterium]
MTIIFLSGTLPRQYEGKALDEMVDLPNPGGQNIIRRLHSHLSTLSSA